MRRWSTLLMFATVACSDSSATSEGENSDAGAVEDLPPCGFENPASIEWIYFEGGEFLMGDESDPMASPAHDVAVPAFFIAKTEITLRQWDAYECPGGSCPLGLLDPRNPKLCLSEPEGEVECRTQTDDHPVYTGHREAQEFAQWARAKLPSEAQWEYAARGGGQPITYPWGEAPPTCELGAGCHGLSPVCAHPSGNTGQGVCDMGGNIGEWTRDIAHSTYDGAPTDGTAWREVGDVTMGCGAGGNPEDFVVVRSGPGVTRVAARRFVNARVSVAGIRLVRDAPEKCDPSR